MLVESLRARRERAIRVGETRREVYVRFLAALTQTDNAIQALAIEGPTPLARSEATAAFRSHQLVAAMYELELIAPKVVCDHARPAYERLRDIRETLIAQAVVVGPAGAGSPEWRAVHEPFLKALAQLSAAMRAESGELTRLRD